MLRSRILFIGIVAVLSGMVMAVFAGHGDVAPGLASASAPASRHIEDPFEYPSFFDAVVEEPNPNQSLRRFNLAHITAEQVASLVGATDIGGRILTVSTNPHVMWARGSADDLGQIRDLIAAVDVSGNTVSLNFRTLTARFLPMSRVLELLDEAGIGPERYLMLGNQIFVFDKELLARWEAVEGLVARLDTPGAREHAVFVQRLYNISAADAADRLASMNLDGVTTETFNYPELSKEIVIISPPDMQDEARRVLSILDGRRLTIRVPIDTASGDNAKRQLEARRSLLSELSGVPESRMKISNNLSGNINQPHYVLWVEESPEVIRRLEELLSRF